mgnify:FL=1
MPAALPSSYKYVGPKDSTLSLKWHFLCLTLGLPYVTQHSLYGQTITSFLTQVMEALLSNKSCFLAEDAWKEVIRSVIHSDDSLSDHKDLAIALWGHLVNGPGRFKEVTDAISSATPPSQSEIDGIIRRLQFDRDRLLGWLTMAGTLPDLQGIQPEADQYGFMFPRHLCKTNPNHNSRLALWGTYVMCRILKSRLLVAMAPRRFSTLEVECQHLVSRIMSLRQMTSTGEGLVDTLFVSQSTWMAGGILATRDSWSEKHLNAGDGMIDRRRFHEWCVSIGRVCPGLNEEMPV